MLVIIRHAQTVVDPEVEAADWSLSPDGTEPALKLKSLLAGMELEEWFSSVERKSVATAHLLSDGPVQEVDGLQELKRGAVVERYSEIVARAFAQPASSASAGWETADSALERFSSAMRPILVAAATKNVAVVSHGLVICLWLASLRGDRVADLGEWSELGFPDALVLPRDSVLLAIQEGFHPTKALKLSQYLELNP